MNVSPEQILAIAALTVSLVQFIKRVLPGDFDEYGPLFSGVISLLATVAWTYQYRPDALPGDVFDVAVLTTSVYVAATGGYTVARQVTASGARSVKKLREMRDARPDERKAAA